MPRADPRFTGLDVIRMFENNLTLPNKRLVVAWFFSLIPVKEPGVDSLQILLDFLSVLPVAGQIGGIFRISLATAQAAKDIAELFGFEFEEQEVELERLRFELQSLTEAFTAQREELRLTQIDLDNANEQANALRATIELLQDELRELEASPPGQLDFTPLNLAIREYFIEVSRLFRPSGDELFDERQGILRAWRNLTGEQF